VIVNVILSISNALAKWLKLELPRIPSADGKNIGTQPLRSDEQSVAWQCHIVDPRRYHGYRTAMIIAVEAQSRYTILLPVNIRLSQEELEKLLITRWAKEIVHLAVEAGEIENEQVEEIFEQFLLSPIHIQWYRNTDLSINGHVSDAEQWVLQTLEEYKLDQLDEIEAITLGAHINRMYKRVKTGGVRSAPFVPTKRFLSDALYRFGKTLSPWRYAHTPAGNYPNPYHKPPTQPPVKNTTDDNVLSMAEFLRKRKSDLN
jgi:hypothetical protein